MFDDSLIDRILRAWVEDQNHPYHGHVKRPVANRDDVKSIVETAFLASYEKEEARPISFSLALAAPGEVEAESHRYIKNIRTFDKPIPLSVGSLTKLAGAFDQDLSSIAVGRIHEGSQLMCWGAFYYWPITHMYNEVPVGPMDFRPDVFTVSARKGGVLQVSRQSSSIGKFINGEFYAATPTPFTGESLGKYFLGFLEETSMWRLHKARYWHYYRSALQYLLLESAARSHGATIVILSPQDLSDRQFLQNHVLRPPQRLSDLLAKVIAAEHDSSMVGYAHKQAVSRYLDRLAQLSAMDGALLLSQDYEIITFGAKLNAPKWEGKVLIGPDGFGRSNGAVFPAERYGTRHSSAINFSGSSHGSTVFVLSQDGAVRAFVKSDAESVLCWPDCTSSMFI